MFYIKETNGRYKPATPDQVFDVARELIDTKFQRGMPLTAPQDAAEFLKVKLSHLEAERFSVIFLDTRHRMLCYKEMFVGTIDGATVHPREVVKEALLLNAAALIIAHNHPSGIVEPSSQDLSLTRRLTEALALVDIRVLDHIIVAGNDHCSLAERGLHRPV